MKTLPMLFATAVAFTMPVRADEAKPAASARASAAKDVTPDEVARIMKEKAPAFVLDVRTPDEFAAGHIPGAWNVDFLSDDFEKQIAGMASFPIVIVHCAAGNRSSQALPKILALKKFGAVYHLKSGFNGWKAAGKPVETKPAAR